MHEILNYFENDKSGVLGFTQMKQGWIDIVNKIFDEELAVIKNEIGSERFESGKFELATDLFKEMINTDNFDEFLTLPAYKHI